MPMIKRTQITYNIYPVTVKETVNLLKPLIDDFRIYRYFNGAESYIDLVIKRIQLLKRTELKLFKQAQKYLGAKRLRLLKEILAQLKLKSIPKQ